MDLTKLRKVESPGPCLGANGLCGQVTAIVKVRRAGYRPIGVKVRGEISANLFTAEFPAEILTQLEEDPEVEAVSVSRPLQVQSNS